MGRRGLLVLAVVAGASVVSLAVAADAIGLGPRDFGWEQKVGVATGATVAWFAGLRLGGWSPRVRRESERAWPRRAPTPTT